MKYVVLEVADEEALPVLQDLLKPYEEVGTSIVGIFKKPTKFCDPSDGHRKGKMVGWSLGTKYGWWVCGKCKKPSEAWGKSINGVLSSARNLLVTEPNKTS